MAHSLARSSERSCWGQIAKSSERSCWGQIEVRSGLDRVQVRGQIRGQVGVRYRVGQSSS